MSAVYNRVLYLDLSDKSYEVFEETEIFERYLGGSGVAIALLNKLCPQGVHPFNPENPVILAPGTFGGLFPSAGKTISTFKSPVTNDFGESHVGGRLGICIKLAGYGAIVITNASESPTSIEIGNGDVRFFDASPLQGLSSLEVERRLRGCAKVARLQSIVSIGPAGENIVSYACVNVDRYNYFGRLGLGAVLGSKKLKAMSVLGSGSIGVSHFKHHNEVFNDIYKAEIETDKMAKYHFTGTPINVLTLNELKALPTKNFQHGQFEDADAISGETLGEKWLERKISCPLCPIGCMHIAKIREPFASGYEYAPLDVYYNYESIYALGSNLCIKTAEEALRLIFKANELGVDTMLTGNVLAWVTEAFENGLIDKTITGGFIPAWGDTETYLRMMEKICSKENAFYEKLAEGVESAAEMYGGQEFAMAINGNGFAGYHTGYASLLGTIVGSRHSHNNNAGYSIDQTGLHMEVNLEKIVSGLIKENEWRYILTSLGVCLFARSIYTEKRIIEALKSIGIDKSVKDLEDLSREVYGLAFQFKFREGFDFNKVKIPRRFFESPTANGILDEKALRNMLKEYVQRKFNLMIK